MEFQNISFKIVFLLLIQAFWIGSFFTILQHVVIRMIKRERLHDWLAFYVPLARNIAWVLFTVKVVYIFGKYQPILILFISTIGLGLVWSIVRDFIQGTVFRFQKGNIVGQEIQLNDYKGRVINMGETKLSLELKNGEIVQLPYQKLFTDVLIKPITNRQIKNETIVLPISNKSSLEVIEKRLTNKVLAYPWVVFKNGVTIEYFTDQNEKQRKIKLSYSVSASSKSVLIEEELTEFITAI